MPDNLVINEIYLSLQGESTSAGLPCIFVRLTGCDLRCSYCDTAYAFSEGQRMTLPEIQSRVRELAAPFRERRGIADLPVVELTGGEPLLQKGGLNLMRLLSDDGFPVLIETSGAHDISGIDPRVRRIMDLKCPSSGEISRNRWANIEQLKTHDEIKFVIGTQEDYQWAKETITSRGLASICPLLVSWISPLTPSQRDPSLKQPPGGHSPLSQRQLAEQIIADALPVRFQIQAHKIIWSSSARGV